MIVVTDHGALRELRFNRPPVNALTTEFLRAIRQGIEQATADGTRAIVLSGSPGIFSAGLDIRLLLGLDRAGVDLLWRELYALMKALASSPIPIAAALTGHAPAGGTVIALFCDWRVAGEGDFRLGLAEVQVGIPLPPVILAALQRQVGPRNAERLAVPGAIISPQEGFRLGLIDDVAPAAQVVERALAWCANLAALPPAAMLATRLRARADLVALFSDEAEKELRGVQDAWWSAEAQSTLRAVAARLTKKAS